MGIICNVRCTQARLTGVQRYTLNILGQLPNNIKKISPPDIFARGITGHLWEQIALPALAGNNLLWSPSNSGSIGAKRQVVTLHDVVSFDHPEWLNKTYVKWYDYMLPKVLKNADHIITISKFTTQRLQELFKIPDSKITLVYNGSDPIIQQLKPGAEKFKIPYKRFVLSLGSLEPRKNIPLLLRAWSNILNQVPEDVGLVIVGGKGNQKVFNDAGIVQIPERVFFTGYISDEHIAQLYSSALFFVYLSVYEGFGLPPLEAMSAGIPVLSGNLTAMPEVIEDAGLLIDPYSLSACENALLKMMNNETLRSSLSVKGIAQARKFDWKECAHKTYEVLKRFA